MKKEKIRKPYSEYNSGYDKDIDNYERLNEKETILLLKKLSSGDSSVRDKLITGNMYLVFSTAEIYKNNGIDFIDLISIGTIGLIKAIDSYDVEKNTSFNKYAYRAISNSILNGIYNESKLIRFPHHIMRELVSNFKSANVDCSIDDIKNTFNLSDTKCVLLSRVLKDPISFGVDPSGIEDLISVFDASFSAEDEFIKDNLKEDIKKAIDEVELSDFDKELISLRFGFDGNEAHSLYEIAKLKNRSAENIRVRILDALYKLSWTKQIESYSDEAKKSEGLKRIRTMKYKD